MDNLKNWKYIIRTYWVIFIAPLLLFAPLIIQAQVLFWGTPSLQFIPWWTFGIHSLKQGLIPLWNPLNGMGAPLLANYQAAFFYPPNWVLLLAGWFTGAKGIAIGYTILAAVHLAWAGLGMALLLSRLGFSWHAQIVGGFIFSLSGYMTGRLGFFSMVWVATWIPWVIYFTDELVHLSKANIRGTNTNVEKKNTGFPFGLAVCLSMQLLAGHAQLTWYTGLLAGIWILFGCIRGGSVRNSVRIIGFFILAVIVATGIAAVQLFPTFEYLQNSQRAGSFAYQDAIVYSFWPWRIITLISPDFFGNPAFGNYWGYASYWEDHIYLGIIPLILALASIKTIFKRFPQPLDINRRILSSFCWFILIMSFILGLGKNTPIFPFLYHHIPSFNMFQAPTRFLIWATFSLPILTAIGIENWRYPQGKGLYWFRLATAGAFAVTLGAGLAWLLVENIRLTFIRATAITGLWALGFGLLTLSIPWAETIRREFIWRFFFISFCLLDLLMIGWQIIPGVNTQLFDQNHSTFDEISDGKRVYLSPQEEYDLKFKRFFRFNDFRSIEDWSGITKTLLPNLNMIYNISLASNFDPLVSERYQRWISAIDQIPPGARLGWLAYTNIGWVERIDVQQKGGVKFDSVQNSQRWHWFSCYLKVQNGEDSWKAIESEMENFPLPDRKIILENPKDITQQNVCINYKPADITILVDKPDRVTLEIRSEQPGWIELMDTWYPGWAAEVSGNPVELYRSDFLFKAVAVNAGVNQVTFFYRPSGFYFGGMFSILMLLCIIWLYIRRGTLLKPRTL